MRIKIISDGTPTGTRVVCAETGEIVKGVTSVEWSHVTPGEASYAIVKLHMMPIEVIADVGEPVEVTDLNDQFRIYAMRTEQQPNEKE